MTKGSPDSALETPDVEAGRSILVSLGVDSSTAEAVRGAVGTSVSFLFFAVGVFFLFFFVFRVYLYIVTQCLSCCLVLCLLTVPVLH